MVGILKKLFKKEKITKKYKNGDIYIGEMKNDEHHGQGTNISIDETAITATTNIGYQIIKKPNFDLILNLNVRITADLLRC